MIEALTLLVFAPLVAGLAMIVASRRATLPLAVLGLLAVPLALWPLTRAVGRGDEVRVALAGVAAPLGIAWHLDALAVAMLWLTLAVALLVSVHALASFPPASDAGQRFWPLWLILIGSMHALFVSADLFNLYVTLELVTLAAVAMTALGGTSAAMRAAMRYLLLGLMASLFYLLSIALLYGQTGTLDLYQVGERLGDDGAVTVIALALVITSLLVKAAIVPLHVWLPAAHAKAPGPVSAVLSGLVVKVALYILIRVWFWTGADAVGANAALVLGLLGATSIVYGSLAALLQTRLKMLVAYSTVAQLGYVMLVFPLASPAAFRAVTFHIVAHGLAKAAMFLAAANILHALGSDRLPRLVGVDKRLPVNALAFVIAGVSIMGLPPSGGFVAKWMLLHAAWQEQGWGWVALISVGGLLATAYVLRVVALAYAQPRSARPTALPSAQPSAQQGASVSPPAGRTFGLTNVSALLLALLAIVLGLAPSPLLGLIDLGLPPGLTP